MERDDIFDEDLSNRSPLALDQEVLLNDTFRIGRVLGVGGFGITYLAFDEVLEMVVAVKEYLPNDIAVRKTGSNTVQPLSSSGEEEKGFEYGLERFLKEARTLAKFERHPNIVRVRTFFEENGTAYLVMNFYQGRTLAEYLEAQNGFIPEEEALLIMDQVLDGLRAVHEEDVLHRDIDPNNVYLADDGTVVLLDFGAARTAVGEQTQSMSVVLKRGYAPHEQYHSHGDQGPWTDIYACSATFYRSLSGYKPPEAAARILNDELAAPNELVPSLSDATNDAILEGLSVRPDDRPQSVDEFAELLPDVPEGAEPGWVGEPTSLEAPSADTESAAELQVTATHACRLYVDGNLSTELPSGETYTLAVEDGSHRMRAVRTDRASSGNATVTASEADPEVEEGSQMSIEALMWQDVVSASEKEPTTVEIDFTEESSAETAAPEQPGTTVAPDDADAPDETAEADDEGTDDEQPDGDGVAEETTVDTPDAPEPETPAAKEEEPVAEPPSGGAVPASDEAPTEKAGPPPEPTGAGDEADVATLRVRTDRPTRLLVDGDRRARIEAGDDQPVSLSPGRHRVRAEATDGAARWEQDVAAGAGAHHTLRISLDRSEEADRGAMVSTTTLQYAGAGASALVLLLLVGWWALSNEPPVATPDRAVTVADPVVVDVVANDRDPDGSQGELRIRSAGPVPDSVAQIETVDSTRLRIQPGAGFAGTTQVPYVLADAPGDTSQARVTLEVPFDGTQRVVTRRAEQPQDVQPVSVGGEGTDVAIAALGDDAVGWVSNSRSAAGRFETLSVLATSRDGAVDVHAADLTGNDRSDLLSASLRGDVVQWHENQADSGFAAPQTLTAAADGPAAVQTADVDADGDLDVIVGALLEQRLLWYENQGNGQFGPGREIAEGVRGLETLHVTDLDNDDTPDLLAVSYRDSTVTRYEPRPDADSVRFDAGPALSMERGGPIEVHTADVTDNGWADVLVGLAGAPSVVLLENRTDTTGTLEFGNRRVLTTDVETVEAIDTGDVEGNGTPDVFAGSFDSDAVVWFKNEGEGTFRPAQPVATDLPNLLSLAVADVDGDDTPDVLAASQAANVVAWYKNHLD